MVSFAVRIVLLLLLIPSTVVADTIGVWKQANGTIEYPAGTVIGVVQGGVPISTVPPVGIVLSQPPFNLTHVMGTEDGVLYLIAPSGQLIPQEEEEDDQSGNAGIIGILGGNGGGGGGSGGGGGAGGGGGGGSAGSTGNNTQPPQPPPPVPPAPPPSTDFSGSKDPVQGNMLCSHYQVFVGGGKACSGGGGGSKRAVTTDTRARMKRDIQGSVSAETANDRARNNMTNGLIDSFEGWQQYFAGIDKSPSTIDMNPITLSYPNHMSMKQDSKRPQLGPVYGQEEELNVPTTDIGTDDEVLKTSMAVYQPLQRMRKDFLEDEFLRDRYLESALTVRGIAVMTMGFLDKTVGAGLTAVQQQADQNTVQELLKQVSWTTSKLANPERAQVYRDTDEKVEACLEIALTKKAAKQKTKGETRKIVDFECDKSCGPAPEQRAKLDYRDKSGKGKEGNGSYSYCVCCAETKSELNKLREEGAGKSGYKERSWSLAERAFYGTKDLKDGGGGGEAKQKVEKMVRVFREMYGDIVLEEPQQGGGGGGANEPSLRYVYVFPKYSVQRRIDALRDGCYYCEGDDCKLHIKGENCPLQELGMEYGICPGISKILKEWDTILQNGGSGVSADIVTAWIEASMGGALSGRSIKNMLSLTGNDSKSVEEPGGKLKRFLDAWCDASARAAFVRYHTQLSAIFGDHLTLNRQINDGDRARMIDLIGRVSSTLSLSQADEDANASVEAALTGLSVQNDREKSSETAAAVAANINGINNAASRKGEVSSFGKLTELFSGEGASTGRDAGFARYGADPIDTVVNELR